MKIMRLIFIFLVNITLISFSYAEDEETWYQIEVLLFQHKTVTTDEQFVDNPTLPSLDHVIELQDEDSIDADYPMQAYDAFELKQQAALLEQRFGYSILLHLAWQQTIPRSAKKIHLFSGPQHRYQYNDPLLISDWQVNGTITLSKQNYFNLQTDLIFNLKKMAIVKLDEKRKLRAKEVHYIDHPLVGMLIKISPIAVARF